MGHIRRVWPTIFWLIRYIYIYCELKSHEALIDNHMNTEQKLPYESPQTEVVEVKQEGIICGSGLGSPGNYPNGGNPFGS